MTKIDNDSRSERLNQVGHTMATCHHCREPLTGRKDDAKYCSNVCKRAAFDERAREGRVASVRLLKNGLQSITVHVKDGGCLPGETVRIG